MYLLNLTINTGFNLTIDIQPINKRISLIIVNNKLIIIIEGLVLFR